MKIFVSGLTGVETTLNVRGFPVTYYPVDYPFFGIKTTVAGSAFRTACGALALGDEVELVTLIGDDEGGARVLKAVGELGLSDRFVCKKLKNTVESVVLQETPFGRRQVYSDLKDVQEQTLDPWSHREAMEKSDVCALMNVNFSRAFIPLAHELGKPIATDVQMLSDVNDPFNVQFIENADILFLSDEGIPASPAEFMNELKDRTPAKVIVMGLGEDGVMYYERGKDIATLKAVAAPDVITAGAGAALFTGFLHYYGKYDCVEALKRAEAFVALKLENNARKNVYPTESDVEKKLATVRF